MKHTISAELRKDSNMDDHHSEILSPPLLRNGSSLPSSNNGANHVQNYVHAATSSNTRKTYQSAIRQFEKWGGRLPTDRNSVIRYLVDKAETLSTRTLDLHLTAISQWHRYQGMLDPTLDPLVRKTTEGIRRTHGKPKRKAKALRIEHIVQMVKYLRELPISKKQHRDIALVMTGYFGAFRRSELTSIEISNLAWEPEGLIIKFPRSKTDQEGTGRTRVLPYGHKSSCPVQAIEAWIELSSISSGPLFRPINRWDQLGENALGPSAINDLLKTLGTACNFDFVSQLSSHSFRRGLSTSAAREGVDFEQIKKQGGWKSDATVWEYIDEGCQFENNASIVLMDKMAALFDQDAIR